MRFREEKDMERGVFLLFEEGGTGIYAAVLLDVIMQQRFFFVVGGFYVCGSFRKQADLWTIKGALNIRYFGETNEN